MKKKVNTLTIEEILTLEENQTFDRKSINITPKDLAIPIVAFANADGGDIVIGITDKTRRIEGKESSFLASKSKKNCYNVNMVYIESVMSINERSTIDFLFDNIQEKTILEVGSLAICHIRRHGCIDGADYMEKRINEIKEK